MLQDRTGRREKMKEKASCKQMNNFGITFLKLELQRHVKWSNEKKLLFIGSISNSTHKHCYLSIVMA